MFRVSQYMHDLRARVSPASVPHTPAVRSGIAPCDGIQASGPRRLPGPVVIWNLIRRCNLTCKHCYSISADTDFAGELSTAEVFDVMDDLKRFHVPVLILSGGEPLLRPDIFDIAQRAKDKGFYTALSSNGTLIDGGNIDRIAAIDFDYVGVSLDGIAETHDRFRRKAGAFAASLAGIRLCRDLGLKVGVRYTMTQDNAHDFEALLRLVEREGIDRFYFSHLNYAGRGNKNRKDDAQYQLTRSAMNALFDTCWDSICERPGEGVHHRQQRCGRCVLPAVGIAAFSRAGRGDACAPAAVGRQCVRRQRGEHRQPGQRSSGHHVVASHAGQCARAAVLRDLVGSG